MSKVEFHSLDYKSKTINFQVIRKKVKNINMRLSVENGVMISANNRVSLGYIKKFVENRAEWIVFNMNKIIEREKNLSVFCDWGRYMLLGNEHIIRIIPFNKSKVVVENDFMLIYTRTPLEMEKNELLLKKWIKNKATEIFEESLNRVYNIAKQYSIPKPDVHIRDMKTRWGTCVVNKQKIWLNLRLIHFPVGCIDYVVMHELAHFKATNHGKDYYNWLTRLMPDWKHWKILMKENL